MLYFKLLPKITYDNEMYEIRNLNWKYYFPNDVSSEYLSTYRMSDGENLESVSADLYTDSSLWWLLAMLNDITDIIFDIPLDEDALQAIARDLATTGSVLDETEYLVQYDLLMDDNDEKRVIRIVKPEFIQKILTEIVRQVSVS